MTLPAIIHAQAYRKAFNLYLRRGIPIELSLKAALLEHPTTHYIWRTRGDNKVRASRAANNGRIFSWDNPPPTGHPGEDYGCRCWAQPYRPAAPEYLDQIVTSNAKEISTRWEWDDFVIHFYTGGGKAVELTDIGHLQDIIDTANEHGLKERQVFEGVEAQICKSARAILSGNISDTFASTYIFSEVSYVYRRSTVLGKFDGIVQRENDYLVISANVDYNFNDEFTDPVSVVQAITRTPKELGAFIIKLAMAKNISVETLIEIYKQSPKRNPDDIHDWIKWLAELGGTKYPITGSWKTALHAFVHKDASKSRYQWPENKQGIVRDMHSTY